MNINTKYLNTRDLGLSKHGNITKKDEWAGPFAVNATLPRFFNLNEMKYFLSIYIKYSRIVWNLNMDIHTCLKPSNYEMYFG